MRCITVFFIAISLLYSCKNTCKEDKAFKDLFFHNISLIREHYDCQDRVIKLSLQDETFDFDKFEKYDEEVWTAICFNSGITNIDFGQPLYANVDSILALWEGWYGRNKCIVSMRKADSIYFEHHGAWLIALDIFFTRIEEGKKKNPNYYYNPNDIYEIADSLRRSRR